MTMMFSSFRGAFVPVQHFKNKTGLKNRKQHGGGALWGSAAQTWSSLPFSPCLQNTSEENPPLETAFRSMTTHFFSPYSGCLCVSLCIVFYNFYYVTVFFLCVQLFMCSLLKITKPNKKKPNKHWCISMHESKFSWIMCGLKIVKCAI